MENPFPPCVTESQHIYHHSDSDGLRINVKVERNSRGFNYEATVTGAKTVDEAMAALKDAEAKLQAAFGSQTEATKAEK